MFGEGKRDKDFIYALTGLDKFKYHTQNWSFTYGNAHECSASDIIRACKNEKTGAEDVVLCFIDLDDLKNDFSQTWKEEKRKLEEDAFANGIKIIWFLDKSEDEFRRVLGDEFGDNRVNREARENADKFINSDLWNRILEPIRESTCRAVIANV
jgi:hypothetical protein